MGKGKARYVIDSHGLNLLRQLLEAEKAEYDNDGGGYYHEVNRLKSLVVEWYMKQRPKATKMQAESSIIMLVDLFYNLEE